MLWRKLSGMCQWGCLVLVLPSPPRRHASTYSQKRIMTSLSNSARLSGCANFSPPSLPPLPTSLEPFTNLCDEHRGPWCRQFRALPYATGTHEAACC